MLSVMAALVLAIHTRLRMRALITERTVRAQLAGRSPAMTQYVQALATSGVALACASSAIRATAG